MIGQQRAFDSTGRQLLNVKDYGRLALTDVSYAPGLNLASHAHKDGKVCLLIQGKYHERLGHQTIHYSPFHCVYHPPDFDHTDRVGENGMRLLSLSFDRALFQDFDSPTINLAPVRELTGSSHVWRIFRLFAAIPFLLPIEIEAAAIDTLAQVVSVPKLHSQSRPSLLAARDFVIENYKSNLTLAEVARAVKVHPVYLGQLFTRELRQTLGDFVNDLRVRAAAEALSCGSVPLAEIAANNGFYDQSHFNRVFSRKVGMPPGAFRRQFHSQIDADLNNTRKRIRSG